MQSVFQLKVSVKQAHCNRQSRSAAEVSNRDLFEALRNDALNLSRASWPCSRYGIVGERRTCQTAQRAGSDECVVAGERPVAVEIKLFALKVGCDVGG